MKTLNIHKLMKRHVLVTRDSARSIAQNITTAINEGQGELALDFSGIDGLTPSFFDEMLAIITESSSEVSESQLKVAIENPPTQLSSKFIAVGKGHDLMIEESETGSWVIFRR